MPKGRRAKRWTPPDVVAVRRRIDKWRQTRQKRSPMPKELWEASVAVARVHGVYRVSEALRVNYQGLKDRVGEPASRSKTDSSRESTRTVDFIELAPDAVGTATSAPVTVVELSDADGAKLSMRFEGASGVNVEALVGAFWRRGR